MNILILGDIVGPSGREAVIKKLPDLIKKKKLDFVIVNGENAADSGVGITKKILKIFLMPVLMLLQAAITFGTKKKQWNLLLKKKDY